MSLVDLSKRQLVGDEGNVLHAYQDNLGYWTIGIGILIDKRKGGGLLPEEVNFIFHNRFTNMKERLYKRFPWVGTLDEARQGALINMAFQLGVEGLAEFRNSLQLIQNRQWELAALHLKLSLWRKQTPNRAMRVIEQIRTGEWQFSN